MDVVDAFTQKNSRNYLHCSAIPQSCKDEPCALGIDEAGRGPVLGPMVYAIAFCPESKLDDLKKLGVDDSKALTEEKRNEMLETVNNCGYIGWAIHILSPMFISKSMYRRGKYNLNSMSHDTAIGLVQKGLDVGVRVRSVFVDTVGPPDKYQAKLEKVFPDLNITVAKKADSLYPCVSAASICAKVARDKALRDWKFAEGIDFSMPMGSGYPGDETTKKFLQDNINDVFGFPSIVRFSWKTAEKLLEERCVRVAFEEVEPQEEESVKKNPSVKDYFVTLPSREAKRRSRASTRHPYFEQRGMTSTTCF